MPKTVTIDPPKEGDILFNVEEKVFPDHKAEPGDKAYVFMHTVPFEGSVGLVNMLTATVMTAITTISSMNVMPARERALFVRCCTRVDLRGFPSGAPCSRSGALRTASSWQGRGHGSTADS